MHGTRPVRVTYELTESGRSLNSVIRTLSDWSERWVDIGVAPGATGGPGAS
ncbi:MAG: winged helix-turn-helix transcriptional regulator [Candidatus Velthaea sp.]